MLRVFSPTGFNGKFPSIKYSESRILRIMGFHGCGRGELHSPFHDTDALTYLTEQGRSFFVLQAYLQVNKWMDIC